MIFYGSLGEPGQWVSAYELKGIDVRRFPVSIIIGEEATVILDYIPCAFMTAEDVSEYCTITLLPLMLGQTQRQLDGKQDKVNGSPGQLAGFDKDGNLVPQAAPRYTAADVGARPSDWMPTAADVNALPIAGGTLTGALAVQAPTAADNPATKKYVDDLVGGIAARLDTIIGEVI